MPLQSLLLYFYSLNKQEAEGLVRLLLFSNLVVDRYTKPPLGSYVIINVRA